jgi:lipopolysaccharide transport system ATP-binding protein
MYMRLAFSVAAHLESEILIVDEVLAVGDAGFQKKCLDKMLEISGRGRTLLFVSHDMSAVSTLCSKALILSHGALIEAPAGEESRNNHAKHAQEHGLLEINSAIWQYIMNGKMTSEVVWEANSAPSYPKGEVVIQTVSLRNKKNVVQGIFDISEDVCVSVEYKVTQLKWSLNSHIYIQSMTGQRLLMSMDNQCSDYSNQLKQIGSYTEICTIPGNLLNEGGYRVELVICTNPTSNVNIVLPDVLCFTMIDERRVGSVRGDWTREWPNYPIRSPMTWEITHT